ncbi:MAG: hypothetical protein ACXAB4_12455 [Candidatus Hodarchaeales archaeon]
MTSALSTFGCTVVIVTSFPLPTVRKTEREKKTINIPIINPFQPSINAAESIHAEIVERREDCLELVRTAG